MCLAACFPALERQHYLASDVQHFAFIGLPISQYVSKHILAGRQDLVLTHVFLCCRFYYAKGMNVDEAYVFVCYDSRAGRARFTPHTGRACQPFCTTIFATLIWHCSLCFRHVHDEAGFVWHAETIVVLIYGQRFSFMEVIFLLRLFVHWHLDLTRESNMHVCRPLGLWHIPQCTPT